jgi:hypothetical protein
LLLFEKPLHADIQAFSGASFAIIIIHNSPKKGTVPKAQARRLGAGVIGGDEVGQLAEGLAFFVFTARTALPRGAGVAWRGQGLRWPILGGSTPSDDLDISP